MAKQSTSPGGSHKKLSTQLLVILIPMIAFCIIAVAVIIFVNSRSIITDLAMGQLEKESKANANDISSDMQGMISYYDGLSDSLEAIDFKDNKEIREALQPGMKAYEGTVIDVYVAFPDKTFIDGGDWVPDADYDPTTRGWYQTGQTSDRIVTGTPDIDMTSKEAVVNGVRKVKFKDGREGVISTDILLKSISDAVSAY